MDILKQFLIGKYHFELLARENITLPPYKGATLRGGFGVTFRHICCVNKKTNNCEKCILKEKCAYSYIFETSPPRFTEKLRNLKDIPRPFVIEPPLDIKSDYSRGEILKFNLILVGKAIEYLPYFIFTFKELGHRGIGKHRGEYELLRIANLQDETVYDSQNESIKNTDSMVNLDDVLNQISEINHNLSLSFITPTRIKFENDLVVKPEFHILIRSLLHRLSALFYFHCQQELELDYKTLIHESESVSIKHSDLKWNDWRRYSSRQEEEMKLGGFTGKVTYQGNFEPFLSLILLGEYTHVGKACTFGLGKYKILKE